MEIQIDEVVLWRFRSGLYTIPGTDIPIKPINRPINRYPLINWIGKSEKLQYRIGIGSADYWAQYRLIGFGSKKRLI